jgi:large subunit ribosomal protein L54
MLRSLALRQPVWAAARGLAKKAKKGDAAPLKHAAEAPSSPVVIGLNLLKEGQDPELRPDSEYPEWVWTLHQERPSLQKLKTKHEDDPESLTELEQRRLYKLWNRARIKENNAKLKK